MARITRAPLATLEDRCRENTAWGTYVGGDWVDLEDCAEQFNIKGGSHETNKCGGDCSACPRSRSRNVAMAEDGTYDVIITRSWLHWQCYSGVSKYKLSVLMWRLLMM